MEGIPQAEEGFSWTKQWYPMAAVKDLDPTRPHAEMLLGRSTPSSAFTLHCAVVQRQSKLLPWIWLTIAASIYGTTGDLIHKS